jgi:DNA-binding CsgD family transcriptional regulator
MRAPRRWRAVPGHLAQVPVVGAAVVSWQCRGAVYRLAVEAPAGVLLLQGGRIGCAEEGEGHRGWPAWMPDPGKLSARERELVTLVAQGRTNAQIAAELYISVRTVGSHLDRIRDKTRCRRRVDLTRLALSARLV